MAEIKNLNRLIRKLDKIKAGTVKEVETVLLKAAVKMAESAKQAINEPSAGREYKRKNKTHVASKAGDAPNTDTGVLINSVFFDFLPGKLTARFGAKAKYARALEYGTSKMEPRPFIKPAFNKHKDEVKSEIDKIIEKVLRENSL